MKLCKIIHKRKLHRTMTAHSTMQLYFFCIRMIVAYFPFFENLLSLLLFDIWFLQTVSFLLVLD